MDKLYVNTIPLVQGLGHPLILLCSGVLEPVPHNYQEIDYETPEPHIPQLAGSTCQVHHGLFSFGLE